MKKLLLFAALFGVLASCQEDPIEPNNPTPNPNPNPTPSSYFISFEVDGVAVSYVQGTNGYSGSTSTGGSIDVMNNVRTVETSGSQIAFDPSSGDIMAYGSVGFNNYSFNLQTYNSDKAAALASITTTGSHPFSTNGGVQGGFFEYYDGITLWSSQEGVQPGTATFNVSTSVVTSNGTFDVLRKIEGTFSGKVYSGGSSKNITNGQYRLIVEAP